MSFAPKGKSLTNLPPAVAAPLLPSSRKSFEANSLIEEREQLSHLQQAQKKRAAELDALRLKLENRAIEIEKVQNKVEERSAALYASQSALDSERRRLAVEFDHKVTELADARDRLEAQVAHMELKEAQLHEAFVRLEKESKEKEHSDALNRAQLAAAWARFEAEKANAVSEAETHLATLASALAASLGVDNADLGFGPASTPAAAIFS
jgi:chromosome segregation ATPase